MQLSIYAILKCGHVRINFEHLRITLNIKGIYNKPILMDNLIASFVVSGFFIRRFVVGAMDQIFEVIKENLDLCKRCNLVCKCLLHFSHFLSLPGGQYIICLPLSPCQYWKILFVSVIVFNRANCSIFNDMIIWFYLLSKTIRGCVKELLSLPNLTEPNKITVYN